MTEESGGLFELRQYRVLFPAAILATGIGLGIEYFVEAAADMFDVILLSGMTTWFAGMGVLFWRRPHARRVLERVLCVGVGSFILVRSIYAVYALEPGAPIGNELAEFAFWLAPFLGLQFLWFGIRMGRRTAVAWLALLALVPVPAAWTGRLPVGAVYGLSMLILAGATSIFVYHVLGRTLIRFGEEKRAVEHLAVTDHLTGIANRRGLGARLFEELARTERYGGDISVLVMDLDHFKRINDEHGHQVGDRVLREIAGILAAECREADTVGRWGGEEFMAVLPAIDADEATAVASRIRRVVAEHGFRDAVNVTVSVGVAEFRAGEQLDDLLARADDALYRAKEAGRDRVELAG